MKQVSSHVLFHCSELKSDMVLCYVDVLCCFYPLNSHSCLYSPFLSHCSASISGRSPMSSTSTHTTHAPHSHLFIMFFISHHTCSASTSERSPMSSSSMHTAHAHFKSYSLFSLITLQFQHKWAQSHEQHKHTHHARGGAGVQCTRGSCGSAPKSTRVLVGTRAECARHCGGAHAVLCWQGAVCE